LLFKGEERLGRSDVMARVAGDAGNGKFVLTKSFPGATGNESISQAPINPQEQTKKLPNKKFPLILQSI